MNWYRVIHDIIPTDVRLHRIRVSPTDNCSECNNTDTLSHRLAECGENKMRWEWIQKIIARMWRMWRKQNALGMDTEDHSENVENVENVEKTKCFGNGYRRS